MAEGGKFVGGRGCRKGQGDGGKKGGGRGWGKGHGVRGGAKEVESIFKWSFQQNSLNISILNFKGKSTIYSNSLSK